MSNSGKWLWNSNGVAIWSSNAGSNASSYTSNPPSGWAWNGSNWIFAGDSNAGNWSPPTSYPITPYNVQVLGNNPALVGKAPALNVSLGQTTSVPVSLTVSHGPMGVIGMGEVQDGATVKSFGPNLTLAAGLEGDAIRVSKDTVSVHRPTMNVPGIMSAGGYGNLVSSFMVTNPNLPPSSAALNNAFVTLCNLFNLAGVLGAAETAWQVFETTCNYYTGGGSNWVGVSSNLVVQGLSNDVASYAPGWSPPSVPPGSSHYWYGATLNSNVAVPPSGSNPGFGFTCPALTVYGPLQAPIYLGLVQDVFLDTDMYTPASAQSVYSAYTAMCNVAFGTPPFTWVNRSTGQVLAVLNSNGVFSPSGGYSNLPVSAISSSLNLTSSNTAASSAVLRAAYNNSIATGSISMLVAQTACNVAVSALAAASSTSNAAFSASNYAFAPSNLSVSGTLRVSGVSLGGSSNAIVVPAIQADTFVGIVQSLGLVGGSCNLPPSAMAVTTALASLNATATFGSNTALYSSNSSVWSSNVTVYSSNVASWSSNRSIALSNTSFWTSNATIWVSNASFFSSNCAVGGCNSAVYASNTANIASSNVSFAISQATYASNCIPWSSNASWFGSNASAFASNVASFASNAAVYGSNVSFFSSNKAMSATATATWSSNTALFSSNSYPSILFSSNSAQFASNLSPGVAFASNLVFPSSFASNTAVWGCNTGVWASNQSVASTLTAITGSNRGTWASNTADWSSNVALYGCNLATSSSNHVFGTLTPLTATLSNLSYGLSNPAIFGSNLAYVLSNPTFWTSNSHFQTSNLAFGLSNPTYYGSNTLFATSNAAFSGSNLAYALSNPARFGSNMAYASSNAAFLGSNLAYISSNPAHFGSNMAYVSSNPAHFGSNMAYVSSNAAFMGSNLAYVSSNAAYLGSNLAYVSSNAAFFGSNMAYVSSNAAFMGSNLAYVSSNAAFMGSNLAYVSSNAAFMGSNLAYVSSNAAFFGSNLAYVSSNAAFMGSNLAYVSSNAAFRGSNLAYVSSNAAFLGSNLAYVSSNAAFMGSNLAYVSSNPAFFGSNTAYVSSNAAYFGSNTAQTSTKTAEFGCNASVFGSNTAWWSSNTASYGSNTSTSAFTTGVWASNIANWSSNILISANPAFASNAASFGSNSAVFSSNSAVFSSNSTVFSSNSTVFSSNSAVFGSNTGVWSSNSTRWSSNSAVWSSNAASFGSNTASSNSGVLLGWSSFGSNTCVWGSNTADWASNAALASSNTAFSSSYVRTYATSSPQSGLVLTSTSTAPQAGVNALFVNAQGQTMSAGINSASGGPSAFVKSTGGADMGLSAASPGVSWISGGGGIGTSNPPMMFPPAGISSIGTLCNVMYGAGQYVPTSSSESSSAWVAFSGANPNGGAGGAWISASTYYSTGSFGQATGNSPSTLADGSNVYLGEWLQLQIPSILTPTSYTIVPRLVGNTNQPASFALLGSYDGGSNWTTLDSRYASQTNAPYSPLGTKITVTVPFFSNALISAVRLVVTRVTSTSTSGTLVPVTVCAMSVTAPPATATLAVGGSPSAVVATGNLGIGTLSPQQRLDVRGCAAISQGVGIGMTTTPLYQLQLSQDSAAKPSTNTWTVYSDQRLKNDKGKADLKRCYDIVKSLALSRFQWKDGTHSEEAVPDRCKLGWYAQDVKKVFPKSVGTNNAFGIPDCHTMNSDQIIAVLYGAVQLMQTRIETLEKNFGK